MRFSKSPSYSWGSWAAGSEAEVGMQGDEGPTPMGQCGRQEGAGGGPGFDGGASGTSASPRETEVKTQGSPSEMS